MDRHSTPRWCRIRDTGIEAIDAAISDIHLTHRSPVEVLLLLRQCSEGIGSVRLAGSSVEFRQGKNPPVLIVRVI